VRAAAIASLVVGTTLSSGAKRAAPAKAWHRNHDSLTRRASSNDFLKSILARRMAASRSLVALMMVVLKIFRDNKPSRLVPLPLFHQNIGVSFDGFHRNLIGFVNEFVHQNLDYRREWNGQNRAGNAEQSAHA